MQNPLPVKILTVSTVLLSTEMCTSLPYPRDIAAGQGDCDKNVPHVTIISATGAIVNDCYKCPQCEYLGHGLNIPCNGQNVTQSQNIECVPCVSGMNYSTGETNQCQPCLPEKCKAGERIVGKCEYDGDKRTCKRCELKHWYYNETQMTCLPCACENMTSEIQEVCKEIGFKGDACDGPKTTTPKAPRSSENDGEVWSTEYTIILVVSLIVIAVLGAACFLVCQRTRIRDWICKIWCFQGATSNRPDTHTPNGNTVGFTLDNVEGVKLLYRECKLQKLKCSDMNAETCRKIYLELKDPGMDAMGMGFTTLAGYMDFSAREAKAFEATSDPGENMLRCWSKSNKKENNVLKLKSLMEKLRRDDIVELLNKELEKVRVKCPCPDCVAVKG